MRSDLRLATRSLLRRPILSTAIIATIGLAIAAVTVAFAVVDGVLLQPLPYATPERLVSIWELKDPAHGRNVTSPANFIAWREQLKSFDRLAAMIETSASVTGDGEPEQVGSIVVSPSYFEIVGARPLAGRFYHESENVEGGPRVVVLSEGYWRRKFGGDPAVVGRNLVINGTANQIVGVLPAQFDYVPRFRFGGTGSRDLWLPPQFGARARTWGGRYLQVIGRLAPGATFEAAQSEATTLASRLKEAFPQRQEGWSIVLYPLHDEVVGDVKTTVWIVFGAVFFVLLIACSNVANLLLTRATERHQEMAVRTALGAARWRLVRQLLAEGFVLAGLGGLAGLLGAFWGIRLLVRAAPDLPRLNAVGLDWSVVGFALLAVVATAILFGLAPATHLAGQATAGWLTQRGSSGRRQVHRLRNGFVAAQVALSFVLLVGAGALIRSLVNRLTVSVGFPIEHLLTADLGAVTRHGNDDGVQEQFDQMVERVAAVPGVERASATSIVPMSGDGQSTGFEVAERGPAPPGQEPVADVRFVHYDYLRTIGVPLLAGRFLGPEDRRGTAVHVLINETGAKLNWPGQSALGKRIRMAWGDTLNAEIVGIVGDVRLEGPDDPTRRATIYWDHRQAGNPGRMAIVTRTTLSAVAIVPAIRRAIHEIDPTIPLYNIRTMDELLSRAVARARFTAAALGAFAVLALILAGLGLYGVMAYATQQREREIGIRIALGADRVSVVRMVLKQGGLVVLPALLLGGVGAVLLARFLQSLVFEVSPADPLTIFGVAGLLAVIAFVACWLPARRASAIDPVTAIRTD